MLAVELVQESLVRATETLGVQADEIRIESQLSFRGKTYIAENKPDLAHDGDALRQERYCFTTLFSRSEHMFNQRVGTKCL